MTIPRTTHVPDVVRRLGRLLPTRADLAAVRHDPRQNLVAGLTVAIVALPLALAFGAASGLGAQAGLVTAVVAGIVAAVFGGSNIQVSGSHRGDDRRPRAGRPRARVTGVLMVGLDGRPRAGGYGRGRASVATCATYRCPVIEGFTAGIAVVIALQQFPAALGIVDASGDKVWASAADAVQQLRRPPDLGPLDHLPVRRRADAARARWRPRVPFSLLGVSARDRGDARPRPGRR